IGIRTLLSHKVDASTVTIPQVPMQRIFLHAVVVAVFNPKTALFFIAFLPQFVEPVQGNIPLQMLALGLLFLGMATITNSVYAFVAGAAGRWLRGNQKFARVQQYVAGTVYIGLGVTAAMVSGRQR
ncbi:MAG: LysE family translocator, partial [Anaerolineae bacterium]|nr:LysE family translocator [Anaerolineae bacterium]